jgi:hypothetical protein
MEFFLLDETSGITVFILSPFDFLRCPPLIGRRNCISKEPFEGTFTVQVIWRLFLGVLSLLFTHNWFYRFAVTKSYERFFYANFKLPLSHKNRRRKGVADSRGPY